MIDLTDDRVWPGMLLVARSYRSTDPEFALDLEDRIVALEGDAMSRAELAEG